MLIKSTAILSVVLIGSLMSTVAGHWKNKERKISGIHPHLQGTRREMCPPGTRFVFSSSSSGLTAGNFAARCEPANIASPFISSNTMFNTAIDVPNFQKSSAPFQPSEIFGSFPFVTGAVNGHQSKGFINRAALTTGLKEKAEHKALGSKLARHTMKHSFLNKF